jgi:hypothetical protein
MLEMLREFLHQKPFRPVRVVLRSGQRHNIVDPEKVAVAATRAYSFQPPNERMTELPESEIELVYVPRVPL